MVSHRPQLGLIDPYVRIPFPRLPRKGWGPLFDNMLVFFRHLEWTFEKKLNCTKIYHNRKAMQHI